MDPQSQPPPLHHVPQVHSPSWQSLYDDLQAAATSPPGMNHQQQQQQQLQQQQLQQLHQLQQQQSPGYGPSAHQIQQLQQHLLSQPSTAHSSPLPSTVMLTSTVSTPPNMTASAPGLSAPNSAHFNQASSQGPNSSTSTNSANSSTNNNTSKTNDSNNTTNTSTTALLSTSTANSSLATTPAAPPPTSGSTPQDFNTYLDFSSVQIDPAQAFSPGMPNSPFSAASQLLANGSANNTAGPAATTPATANDTSAQTHNTSLSPAQQNQLQQLQHYQQLQNIQQQMQLLQQQQQHQLSPAQQTATQQMHQQALNLRNMPQTLQNSHTLNILQNSENLDTFFREFFQDYSNPPTLDSLMIDSAASATSPGTATSVTISPSSATLASMPPPTPTTSIDGHNAIMTNEIFRSPLAGPMDKASTAGSTTTEDFTPLMSPAVTPFDSINPGIMPPSADFTMPGSYFTTVSAPIVEEKQLNLKQTQTQIQPPPQRRQRRANSKKSTPVLAPMVGKAGSLSAAASSASLNAGTSARITKASPMIRPSRRSSSNLPSLVSSTNTSPQIQASVSMQQQQSSSSSDHQGWSSDSVSPEGLADIVMPPPQKRQTRKQQQQQQHLGGTTDMSSKSAGASKSKLAAAKNTQTSAAGPASTAAGAAAPTNSGSGSGSGSSTPGLVPVTPASLMNLPEKDVDMLDVASTELHLRNAVQASKNVEKQEQTRGKPLAAAKPVGRKQSVQMSPKTIAPLASAGSSSGSLQPRRPSSRRGSSTKSMLPSPSLAAQGGSAALIKPKLHIASGAAQTASWKPRHGTSSSPVLRPKISPHISPRIDASNGSSNSGGSGIHHISTSSGGPSPLMRKNSSISSGGNGGSGSPTLSADISLVLASKSNYQNIVEGTHSQLGLSYPESLSADLTSKRTSHKLAEQGRRNRINSALTDLAKLLAPAHQTSSKASTVEMAIAYINTLHREIADLKTRLGKYEAPAGGSSATTASAKGTPSASTKRMSAALDDDEDDDEDDDCGDEDDDDESHDVAMDSDEKSAAATRSQLKKTRSATVAAAAAAAVSSKPGPKQGDLLPGSAKLAAARPDDSRKPEPVSDAK